jgi:hypothetical protein
MADNFKQKSTYEGSSSVNTRDTGLLVEDMKTVAKNRRRIFERRWYDNNFFDDGFHFRYLSRSSNKIVDLSERATIYTPQRSIPKASRQIRGIANLLLSSDPTPTVYPTPVKKEDFPDIPVPPEIAAQLQQQGQQVPESIPNPMYEQAVKMAKEIAHKKGEWLLSEWKEDDGSGESVLDKLALMAILTLKHGVSYLKIWPDEHEEKICTSVRDAFDLYLLGNLTSIYESPFIVDAVPTLISQIKANPLFDKDQLAQITPDNKKASSEIKEAYLQSRYGRDTTSDQAATLILNEVFTKEYVSKENMDRIREQEDGEKLLKKRKMGDPIIRQMFTAGGVWLYDHYTNLSEYPYVDYRVEPGPIYQVPMIERFMPANKSLDSIVSRVERYTHTMVTGAWLKRRGEQFNINNIAGGQIIEYEATPPTQANIAPLPAFVFNFISLLTNFIEEQGVSTTTLGKIPAGVKAHSAIESLKESEYANLVIASRRLKASVKKIAQKCLEIADENYVEPHDVTYKNKGDVVNFQVMGAEALRQRKKLKVETPDVVSLSKNDRIDIEIEQGMAYTKEGQKETMQSVINTMIELLNAQAIPPQALQLVAEKYLKTYQFGSTEEFMDVLDEAYKNGAPNITEQQMLTIKTALLEALKEAGEVGPEASNNRINENKIGILEALQEAGIAPKTLGGNEQAKESISINYKDAPEDIKRQMEADAGFNPSGGISPAATDQMSKHAAVVQNAQQLAQQQQQAEQQAELQRQQMQQQRGGQNGSS